MALLHKLADELISEIISYLVNGKPLLCNVAIQSKRLSELVRPLLVRRVQVITSPTDSKQHSLFMRSIKESSLLASMVQDISIAWSDGNAEVWAVNNKLLERMSSLRSLTLDSGWDRSPWDHEFLETNSLDRLTHVNLNMQNISTADMVKYMFLRQLESMSVMWMARPTMPVPPSNRLYGDSNIASLYQSSNFHLPEKVLKEILRFTGSLKKLYTSLPGGDIAMRCFGFGRDMVTPLSPIAITRALDLIKHSLTEFTLVDENCVWPSHDRSRTDLSNFTALRKLQISSLCYFRPGVCGRDWITHLLPAPLQEIEVLHQIRLNWVFPLT
jgi:hypothetical protein